MNDSDSVRALKVAVDNLVRPIAKAQVRSPRDIYRDKSRAALEQSVAALVANGMSLRGVASSIGVDVHTLHDWIHGNRQVPAWALHALPRGGQVVYVRRILDSLPPESDGELRSA